MRSFSLALPISRSTVHLTSAAVKGLPSCHLTLCRRGKSQLRPLLVPGPTRRQILHDRTQTVLRHVLVEHVRTLDHYLSALEAASGLARGAIRVIAIATETPAAMLALANHAHGAYVGVSARLEGITWGAEDLAAALGGHNRRVDGIYDDVYRLARSLCLLAAAAAEAAPIDTIYTDFRDEKGLAAECAAARRSGFTAKMAIHPAQIAVINAAFSVTDEELLWARKIVGAFAENPGAGTLALDGKMVDRPHLTLARRLLGLASA
jgi:citrate lyase subunit beta/citryl-CoA lyase